MQVLKAGQIICSMAGHDKGQFYIIIGVENEYVFLVDGKYKLLNQPKKKNKKHIQYVADVSKQWTDKPNDLLIKRILKDYKKLLVNENAGKEQ